MQIHLERRTGTDRREIRLSGGHEWPGSEASLGSQAGDDTEIYDPYDPYWEPVKGQDDD